jgi:adenylyltransferase/sulfurtransferase
MIASKPNVALRMFELTSSPIDAAALAAQLGSPEAGALTVFEGRVRNHHLGRPVTHLEYEAFDDLAQREGEAIVAETERLYPGTRVLCVHRTGTLQIGEAAVWIGVASAHRQAGFAACRHVIEEIKRRLPVWKKEHHPDGAAEWVNCSGADAPPAVDAGYHARQIALPEVGTAGQAKLAAARVLVVGVGGLGCPAALYLAGAGIGRLTLVDGGRVELSNLHRQILFTAAEIGAPKTLAAAARLRLHNPAVEVIAHEGDLTATNARALVTGQSVVLDCTDNFRSRFVVHDACRGAGVPLVSAAVHAFEGELTVFTPETPGCLHCQWPSRRPDELDALGGCAGGPVFAPTVGLLGVLQATEVIKLLLRIPGTDFRHTRLFNLLDGSVVAIERTANPSCPVCSRTGQIRTDANPDDAGVVLTEEEYARLGGVRTVALVEPGEPGGPEYIGREIVPVGDLLRLRELAAAGPLVLVCRSGVRSAALARLLRAEGLANIHALGIPRCG